MKIDVTLPFMDFDGEPEVEVKQKRDASGEMRPAKDAEGKTVLVAVTFRTMARLVLNHVHPDEKELRNSDIYERGALIARINTAHLPIDLEPEEVALIKTLAGKCAKAGILTTYYFMQLQDMLNAKSKEPATAKTNGVERPAADR